MRLVEDKITAEEVNILAGEFFGDFVKAVVDVDKEIMAIGGELHSDEEALLLNAGSFQQNLWGINIYPGKPREERVEFDSMINIRPRQNNRSRGVEDPATREIIISIVNKLIE